jgi:hypothetical protein
MGEVKGSWLDDKQAEYEDAIECTEQARRMALENGPRDSAIIAAHEDYRS